METIKNVLEAMTKDELIEKCRRLLLERNQLRNLLRKRETPIPEPQAFKRPIQFSKYNKRHVFLKFVYIGWAHDGFVQQDGLMNTVEDAIFKALKRTRLCDNARSSRYSRCGRTDLGVSAFSQVISIDLRSSQSIESAIQKGTQVGLMQTADSNSDKIGNEEIKYVELLNRVLPWSIRMLAWCPVHETKNARFDCLKRCYHYYFQNSKQNLDIERMNNAAMAFEGKHDFRNFCKIDRTRKSINFTRVVYSAKVEHVTDQFYRFVITGSGFLWHQVRFIMSVLFLIGEHKETVSVVDCLLDVEKCKRRPQYSMASEKNLVLYDCQYDDGVESQWIYPNDGSFFQSIRDHSEELALEGFILAEVCRKEESKVNMDLEMVVERPSYIGLLNRPTCGS
ncbi:hypothetical protein ACOME3_003961 [Neoechinorhynchus agilis]